MKIRVNDPGRLLPAPSGKHPGTAMSLRIASPSGRSNNIPIVNTDARGRDHAIVIPYDTPHKLAIQSAGFALEDDSNRALAGSAPIDVQIARGAPPSAYVVNVTRKVQP